MEVSRELPPGEEQELDTEKMTRLIRKAVDRTLTDLKKDLTPPMRSVLVPRIKPEGSITQEQIATPSYLNDVVFDWINKIRCTEESIALVNYVWECRALKLTLTGPDPQKEDWTRFIYDHLVWHPLLRSLERTAQERLIDDGKVAAWQVEEDILKKDIEDTVALCTKQGEAVIALCPLSEVKFPSENIEFSPDIRLRRWSRRDTCVFRFRDSQEFLWDDFKVPGIVNSVAEVSFSFPFWKRKIIQGISFQESQPIISKVQDSLDLLKWALFVATDSIQPVAEGTCLIKGRHDVRIARLLRDQNLGSSLSLDGAAIERCKKLIADFRAVAGKWKNGIQQALWHFGRACVATLPRDILLESAMGLDGLIVPGGGGDSRYRFCLHGAVILSSKMGRGREFYDELNNIYSQRSRAAHGGEATKDDKLAADCRKKLAAAIERIVVLILNNELPTADDLAVSVQRYVIEQATMSVFPFPLFFAK